MKLTGSKEEKDPAPKKDPIKIDFASCTCGWQVSGKYSEIEGKALVHSNIHMRKEGVVLFYA